MARVLGGWLATAIGLRGAIWVSAVGALLAPVPLLLSGLSRLERVRTELPGSS